MPSETFGIGIVLDLLSFETRSQSWYCLMVETGTSLSIAIILCLYVCMVSVLVLFNFGLLL